MAHDNWRLPMALLSSCLLLCLLSMICATSVHAVMGDEDQRPPPNNPDYASGLAAFERGDWQAVIDSMEKVIAQRPWRDNAHNLMGFAYRKLGQYRRAITHYRKALDLNPYHRGALEYLGEAYLDMGCPVQAQEMLQRLETVCKRLATDRSTNRWQSDCDEWQDLKAAIEASPGGTSGSDCRGN